MKVKSILTKSIAVAAFAVAGVAALGTTNHDAQAAVVKNDADVYNVYTSTKVYKNYKKPVATGQVLEANTSWKVIKTAYDKDGHKWYDLGKNQWVKVVKHHAPVVNTTSQNNAAAQTQSQTQTQTQSSQAVSQAPQTSYTSNATGSEAAAKAWIAGQESGGSYAARNGQYVGKYQLSASYLNGDYSAANQERAADNYVTSRYGSWTAAKSFWQANGWY
ncbi:hypothetical protein EJK17_05265 [Lactobacillus xujianguonis]|uniref:Agregation promoting protein n=1 Tax=Lactobacillus xujianguonis TaxID=2495899 RepID=A0A437SV54_9LACO|nr:hypothetical protein [Lactobacillus xujianguonis]RVU70808.1 hypothetical protein EJK17_05265 [Lactobacillus xujianguonis]RVU77000.1 hypothetical protein EJK20_02505 [Lactobacillus xujianguonis]